MGLVHQFAIIPKDSDVSMVSSDMDSVSISDMIIQYIGDSLKWKLNPYLKKPFIEDGEITKLKNILKQWVELFRLSPDEFYLTGEFLLDEERYENILVKKGEIIKNLNSCIYICEKAINEGKRVLHNGI